MYWNRIISTTDVGAQSKGWDLIWARGHRLGKRPMSRFRQKDHRARRLNDLVTAEHTQRKNTDFVKKIDGDKGVGDW